MNFLDHLPDAFKWYALFWHKKFLSLSLKPAPSDQNLTCINFFRIGCNKGHFWFETTVIFKKKTAKDVHFGNIKIKQKKNQICEKLYIK